MLAIAFGFLSLFSSPGFSENPKHLAFTDTVRLPGKNKITTDTVQYLEVNRIFILGNKITRDRIILRELSLKPGDIVTQAELPLILDRDKKKLFNTHLFNTTDVRPLEAEPGKIDLLVEVNERWYTFPSPRFDLFDGNFNAWWQNYNHDFHRVVYGLTLFQYNMRGRNETLKLTALFGYQRTFEISYRIPYIDRRQKQGLIIDFDFLEAVNLASHTEHHKLVYMEGTDQLKVTRGGGLTYTYRNSFYETHALKVDYRSSQINERVYSDTLGNPNYYSEGKLTQQYGSLTYQFSSDHRDIAAYPLKGYQFSFFIRKLGLSANDDLSKTESQVTYSRFMDFKKGFYLSNLSSVYLSSQNGVPYANYSALGYGRQLVRGYEVYVIEGPNFFLNKATFKKLIFSRKYRWNSMPLPQFQHVPFSVYLKTYADIGYVQNYPFYESTTNIEKYHNNVLTNKLLAGAGGGIDIVSWYDLVIRLEYTFNAEGQRGFFFNLKKEF